MVLHRSGRKFTRSSTPAVWTLGLWSSIRPKRKPAQENQTGRHWQLTSCNVQILFRGHYLCMSGKHILQGMLWDTFITFSTWYIQIPSIALATCFFTAWKWVLWAFSQCGWDSRGSSVVLCFGCFVALQSQCLPNEYGYNLECLCWSGTCLQLYHRFCTSPSASTWSYWCLNPFMQLMMKNQGTQILTVLSGVEMLIAKNWKLHCTLY